MRRTRVRHRPLSARSRNRVREWGLRPVRRKHLRTPGQERQNMAKGRSPAGGAAQ